MTHSIIIIDDDPDDAELIKRSVLSLHPKSPVRTVGSSKELRDYLDGEGRFADRETFPYPNLILLDIRMPEITGLETLEWLKRERAYSGIPVIVVSSFDRQRDIRKAYQLGACTFLSKPIDPVSFRAAVRGLKLPIEFSD
jgi:CheY-like chemotaxis protein